MTSNITSKEKFEQLQREKIPEPNFEVMLNVMELQDLIITCANDTLINS
jgi:hypothetical protein